MTAHLMLTDELFIPSHAAGFLEDAPSCVSRRVITRGSQAVCAAEISFTFHWLRKNIEDINKQTPGERATKCQQQSKPTSLIIKRSQ